MTNHLEDFAKLMWQERIPESVIMTFAAYYNKLVNGVSSKISKKMIQPPSNHNLINFNDLQGSANLETLRKTVLIKLNGGLGTSMGLSKAKSLLPVKGNMNFLDIIARQVLTLRAQQGVSLYLLFMDSYNTQADTLKYLGRYPDLAKDNMPLDFLQNKFPRVRQEDFAPFVSEETTQMWNPPGHGDIYAALDNSGLLDSLIAKGIVYAFISNSDNLGATVDAAIPTYMEKKDIPFLIEVCIRSEVDKKGGHLSEDKNGSLLLREIAQCPEDEINEFQNIEIYKYFNTNNIWINLLKLKEELVNNNGVLLLPMIVNPKVVNGTPVYQIETAMGAAISTFAGAKALVVPRSRFAPVKKTTDLLAVWSDAFELNDQYQIALKRTRKEPPLISLDDRFYGKIDLMLERFTDVPSLQNCDSLSISGDITFGEGVICKGNVCIMSDRPVKLKDRICEGIINL
ncbi:MAG: UTP--glucose-1-phosphate uridylyltransferase [Candidatus Cloacimonadaceae bacterium]